LLTNNAYIVPTVKIVKHTLGIDRKLAYLEVNNDLVWEFVDATGSAYSPALSRLVASRSLNSAAPGHARCNSV
jgi:hypothetical protein